MRSLSVTESVTGLENERIIVMDIELGVQVLKRVRN